jgi:arylsulfatase A-like enzyme
VAKQPNILWICTDQQRWDTIGALSNDRINTPNIDRLVAEGVACTHAFCQSPICTPSRASFLTGMYPDTIHACSNGNERYAEAAPLVTKLLADADYCCGLSGKLHLAGAHGRIEPRPEDDGYTVFQWSHSHRDLWPAGHAYANWVRSQGVNLGAHYRQHGSMPTELHQTTFCAEKAIEFIDHNWDQPWLMSVNIFDPHPPFDPPDEYRRRYDPDAVGEPDFVPSDMEAQELLSDVDFQSKPAHPDSFGGREKVAAYYAMIELIDWNVGRMMEALERTGQRENTLVIFTSDHGEMLGDHGLLLKGCRLYDSLVRVPLIFSWPGVLPEGRRTDALVELTDIAPTLLDFAGVDGAERMAGKSLRPLLTGKTEEHRRVVRSIYFDALSLVNPERTDFKRSRASMIRTKKHKLCVYHGTGQGELFDMEEDPGEHDNHWNDPAWASLRLELTERAFDAAAKAADTGPEPTRVF